jgi:hypothetical protein
MSVVQFAGVFVPDAPIAARGPIECPPAENSLRTFAQIGLCDAKSAGVQVRASAGLDAAPRKRRRTHRRCLEAIGPSQCVIDLNAEIKPFF